MNAPSQVEPARQSAQSQPRVLHAVPVRRMPDDLAIDESTAARWRALDDAKRARVAAFLADVRALILQLATAPNRTGRPGTIVSGSF